MTLQASSPRPPMSLGWGSLAYPLLPELLSALVSQVSLGCSCVWGLEVPSCIGVLLLARAVCFPAGQGVAVPSKPN